PNTSSHRCSTATSCRRSRRPSPPPRAMPVSRGKPRRRSRNVLIRRHDEPLSDAEWRLFLAEHDFGELIAPGVGRDLPIVVPAHFIYDGDKTVLLHLAKPNPVWDALAERPRALLSVFGAYTYIPGHWNQDEFGVPTSSYAA